jgi:hypothetical protein
MAISMPHTNFRALNIHSRRYTHVRGENTNHQPQIQKAAEYRQNKVKVNAKLSLCFFNRAPHHEGVLGELRYSSTHSLNPALDRGELNVSIASTA